MSLLVYFLVMAAAMVGLSRIMPGFEVRGWVPALFGAVVLATVNTIVKPILFVLTLPFTIITLGLFLLLLNGFMLWLTQLIVPGFRVAGLGTLVVAALILSCVSMVWKAIAGSGSDRSGSRPTP